MPFPPRPPIAIPMESRAPGLADGRKRSAGFRGGADTTGTPEPPAVSLRSRTNDRFRSVRASYGTIKRVSARIPTISRTRERTRRAFARGTDVCIAHPRRTLRDSSALVGDLVAANGRVSSGASRLFASRA